jgi:4a-hydroxytetrahydrobiopterin dehydratase
MSRTPLTHDQVHGALTDLPHWEVEHGQLTSTRRFATFRDAIAFVDAVADVAEDLDHHPDIDVRWRTVRLAVCTHDQGNQITGRDIDLARAVDALTAAE